LDRRRVDVEEDDGLDGLDDDEEEEVYSNH
jgi:hypothetical protein